MKQLSALLVCLVGALLIANAEDAAVPNPYTIGTVKRTTKLGINKAKGYRTPVAMLEVPVRVTAGVDTAKVYAHIYFYDAQNKAYLKLDPMDMSSGPVDKGGSSQAWRSLWLTSGQVTFEAAGNKGGSGNGWAHAVIVFGDEKIAACLVYPPDDLSRYDFPEKALVPKSTPRLLTPAAFGQPLQGQAPPSNPPGLQIPK